MIVAQLTIDIASSSTLVGRIADVETGDIGTVGTFNNHEVSNNANQITIVNHGTAGPTGDTHCFPFCKDSRPNPVDNGPQPSVPTTDASITSTPTPSTTNAPSPTAPIDDGLCRTVGGEKCIFPFQYQDITFQ